jgi:hypothetical protein
MDAKVAKSVLNELKEGGFISDTPYFSDEQTVSLAQEWYEEAKKEADKGGKHPTVLAIVNLVEGQLDGNTANADEEVEGSDRNLAVVENNKDDRHELERLVSSHNLPVPQDFDSDPEPMPRDLDDVTDKQLRRLSGVYNAYLGRVSWLSSIAQSDLSNATHLRSSALRKAFKKVHAELVSKDQRPTKDIVNSLAEEEPDVKVWDGQIKTLQDHVLAYKTLIDIYKGNVDRLSREATMRQWEWERGKG